MITVFVVIAVATALFCLAPLRRPAQRWLADTDPDAARRRLEAEKESFLRAIKDVEFEHASGKINSQDYERLKRFYTMRAAEAMAELDKLAGGQRPTIGTGAS
ncbi:MAG TPA: hypothetical protein ENJ73_02550 [Desulfobacterales bacterium]|nr:hypothetical protein [Desulfobacterales bacterium]